MGELKKQIQFNSLCKQFDEKNREKYPKERFSLKEENLRLKFNPGLAFRAEKRNEHA